MPPNVMGLSGALSSSGSTAATGGDIRLMGAPRGAPKDTRREAPSLGGGCLGVEGSEREGNRGPPSLSGSSKSCPLKAPKS